MNVVCFGLSQQTTNLKTFAMKCVGRGGTGSLSFIGQMNGLEKKTVFASMHINRPSIKNRKPELNYYWIIK